MGDSLHCRVLFSPLPLWPSFLPPDITLVSCTGPTRESKPSWKPHLSRGVSLPESMSTSSDCPFQSQTHFALATTLGISSAVSSFGDGGLVRRGASGGQPFEAQHVFWSCFSPSSFLTAQLVHWGLERKLPGRMIFLTYLSCTWEGLNLMLSIFHLWEV